MRIILLSLERAVERRAKMEKQFAHLNLDYEIWNAVDAEKISNADYQEKLDTWALEAQLRGRSKATLGEIACFLSHQGIMREIADSQSDVVAVIEDDADLSSDFPQVLSNLERMTDQYDVVMLHRYDLLSGCRRKLFSVGSTPIYSDIVLGRLKFSANGTCGYVITCSAARWFIKRYPRMTNVIDLMVTHYWENGLNLYYLNRPIMSPDHNSISYIAPGVEAIKKLPIRRSLKAKMRRFFFKWKQTITKRSVYWYRRFQDQRRLRRV